MRDFEKRLAARDRERHAIRQTGMRGVGNWATGNQQQNKTKGGTDNGSEDQRQHER